MHAGRLGLCLALAGGCAPPDVPVTTYAAPPAQMYALADLVGTWRWLHRTTEAGTTRLEDEVWTFRPGPIPTRVLGRYARTLDVRSDDGVPFECNQRTSYRQRAWFEVEVEVARDGFVVHETAYRAEPSPCDHGFRHTSSYRAEVAGPQLRLSWDGGMQTLLQIPSEVGARQEAPWRDVAEAAPVGAWRWSATSFDDEGHVHDETEWWQVTARSATQLDLTYRRRVTVRSADGAPIACARAASWTFDDAYVLEGHREDEHWHFYERAVDPGDHACTRLTPHRALDEATAEQIGDYLILEWRGKRRQVLYRPEP